jgi:hypothetical protein
LALSQANTELGSTKTIGITATAIANNANGEVIIFGLAESLDTTAFAAGSALWLSPTVPGGMTTTKPSAPNHMVFIGFVTRSHPTDGTIEVKVQNGFELEELHNVAINSLVNDQVIRYEAASQLWKNHTLVKGDVGLGNVDNTSDANKPVSTATQTALNLKYDATNPAGYVTSAGAAAAAPVQSVNGETGIVVLDKSDIGLGNVDNTSDINKPISTATQTALDKITNVTWTGDYNNGVTYSVGQGVMFNGASYRMISFIGAAGYPPPSYPGSWLQVTDYVSPNDIGLGNVDNTSDLTKPVSVAQNLNSIVNALIFG